MSSVGAAEALEQRLLERAHNTSQPTPSRPDRLAVPTGAKREVLIDLTHGRVHHISGGGEESSSAPDDDERRAETELTVLRTTSAGADDTSPPMVGWDDVWDAHDDHCAAAGASAPYDPRIVHVRRSGSFDRWLDTLDTTDAASASRPRGPVLTAEEMASMSDDELLQYALKVSSGEAGAPDVACSSEYSSEQAMPYGPWSVDIYPRGDGRGDGRGNGRGDGRGDEAHRRDERRVWRRRELFSACTPGEGVMARVVRADEVPAAAGPLEMSAAASCSTSRCVACLGSGKASVLLTAALATAAATAAEKRSACDADDGGDAYECGVCYSRAECRISSACTMDHWYCADCIHGSPQRLTQWLASTHATQCPAPTLTAWHRVHTAQALSARCSKLASTRCAAPVAAWRGSATVGGSRTVPWRPERPAARRLAAR
jgi:hypothetical protein